MALTCQEHYHKDGCKEIVYTSDVDVPFISFNDACIFVEGSKDLTDIQQTYNQVVYHKYDYTLIQHWFFAEFILNKIRQLMMDPELDKSFGFFLQCEIMMQRMETVLEGEDEFRKTTPDY